MNVIIDTLSPSYRKMRAEQDAELEKLRGDLATAEAETWGVRKELGLAMGRNLELIAERDDLRAKLAAANTELHELRIRAARVAELEANEQKLRKRLEEVLDSLHRRFDGM